MTANVDRVVQGTFDRRDTSRRRVLKGAVLSFNGGFCAFDCVVRNESDGGAQLTLGETSAIPPVFTLRVAGDEALRTARVRWRSTTAVGVEFE